MSNPKHQVFVQVAGLARALGHAHRLELLEHLSQRERSVESVARLTGLSIANASQHLQQLRRHGLARSRRDGKRVLYRLGDGPIIALLSALRRVAEHNVAELREILADRFDRLDGLEPISRETLARRLGEDRVTLLDVRPEDEFAEGHLPGAINIPLAALHRRLAQLRPDREIVAYCRGPYCVLAFEAVAELRCLGYRVRRLEDGFPEWRAAGLPVEGAAADGRG